LTPRTVEGEDQLAAQPLAERMVCDQRLELADDLHIPAELEISVDPLLQRRQA
jgi:hypothetical protein